MNQRILPLLVSITLVFASAFVQAEGFTLQSKDIAQGQHMKSTQEYQGFGCKGSNLSPQLSWQNPPKGTQAFAVFAYDPDAPTGSGWWHWQLVNIPANVLALNTDAGNTCQNNIPTGSVHITNDYGSAGFGGACPPKGHGVHRYQFTVYALSQKLDLPENASGALTGYMVKAHALGFSTLEALYKRD